MSHNGESHNETLHPYEKGIAQLGLQESNA